MYRKYLQDYMKKHKMKLKRRLETKRLRINQRRQKIKSVSKKKNRSSESEKKWVVSVAKKRRQLMIEVYKEELLRRKVRKNVLREYKETELLFKIEKIQEVKMIVLKSILFSKENVLHLWFGYMNIVSQLLNGRNFLIRSDIYIYIYINE